MRAHFLGEAHSVPFTFHLFHDVEERHGIFTGFLLHVFAFLRFFSGAGDSDAIAFFVNVVIFNAEIDGCLSDIHELLRVIMSQTHVIFCFENNHMLV